MTVKQTTTWAQQTAGLYRKGAFTLTRETDDAGKQSWVCRYAGKVFDRAATLAEAKASCGE